MSPQRLRALSSSGKRRQRVALWFMVAGLALLVAETLWAQRGTGVITGRITGLQDQNERVLVHLLESGDIPAGDCYTDSNGNFSFTSLPNGPYYLVVEQEGYSPVRVSILLEYPPTDPRALVDISMEPLSREPAPPGRIIQGSSKSYELNAKNPSKPFNPKALREFEKGKQKQKDGELGDAARHYQKAIGFDPSFYPALNNLGVIYIRQKQFAKANEAFLQVLKLNPDDSQAYINMGHLRYQQGNYQEAIAELEQGLERSPGSALGRFLLGSAYLKVGGLEKAETNLKKACALDPKNMPQAHLQLANVYLLRGEASLASTELESYLRVNPSDPQAPAMKKLLVKLKPN